MHEEHDARGRGSRPKLRRKPRSGRRCWIAHTPNWQVNDEMIEDDRRRQDQVERPFSVGPQRERAEDVAANCVRRPDAGRRRRSLGEAGPEREVGREQARRRTSPREVMNSSIPRTGLPIPPAAVGGGGRRVGVGGGEGGGVGRHRSLPVSARPSGRAGRRTPGARSGSPAGGRSCTGGGGDEVAHSRVLASHGSSPAILPLRSETNTFQRNGSIEAAMMNPPIVASEVELVPAGRRSRSRRSGGACPRGPAGASGRTSG